MRPKLFLYAILFIAFMPSNILRAQVTIGSGNSPNLGTLLDLKEEKDGSSVRGLALPKVKLTSLTDITNGDIAGITAANADLHIGLMVYNVEEDVCAANPIYKGIYIYDGVGWQYLQQQNKGSSGDVYSFKDTRDNETYLARNFGTAGDWMLENVRYDPNLNPNSNFTGFTHTAAGVVDPYTDKHYCYPQQTPNAGYLNYNSSQARDNWGSPKNGLLYNWPAATNGENTSDQNQGQPSEGVDPAPRIQGICPSGWHLPSDKEWNDLERELYTYPEKYSAYTTASKQEFTPTLWNPAWEYGVNVSSLSFRGSSSEAGHGRAAITPCSVSGSTIKSQGKSKFAKQGGLDVLLVGWGFENKTSDYGYYSFYWTNSSHHTPPNAWYRHFYNSNVTIKRDFTGRNLFLSVRCKRD